MAAGCGSLSRNCCEPSGFLGSGQIQKAMLAQTISKGIARDTLEERSSAVGPQI